ncbi:MAG: cupredoxin domain-containing protein [Polyangiales bacterium]
MRFTRTALAVAVLFGSCGCGHSQAAPPPKGSIAMLVTENGFEPNELKVKQGEPVTLLITRKTDATCAKAIVIDEYAIHADLPLGKQVAVSFTPNKTGRIKYGCAMDKMISGVLIIE